jgi:hypothetical protein
MTVCYFKDIVILLLAITFGFQMKIKIWKPCMDHCEYNTCQYRVTFVTRLIQKLTSVMFGYCMTSVEERSNSENPHFPMTNAYC